MVELESKGNLPRHEVASFLRELANELDPDQPEVGADPALEETREHEMGRGAREGEQITFIIGGDSATVTVPETIAFDVDVASRSPLLSSGKRQGIELDFSWELDPEEESSNDHIELK